MGAITDVVKRRVPASYRAMVEASSAYYGITQLQALADYVQFRLFATVPGASQEASVYNLAQRELVGVLTTMRFIPAAIDFWGEQLDSESVQGPSESISYRDPRPDLWKLFDNLSAEAQQLAAEISVPAFTVKAVKPKVSYGDNGRGILITDDPATWPSAWETSGLSYDIPWGAPLEP